MGADLEVFEVPNKCYIIEKPPLSPFGMNTEKGESTKSRLWRGVLEIPSAYEPSKSPNPSSLLLSH